MRRILTITALALGVMAQAQTVLWEAPVTGNAEKIFLMRLHKLQLLR